MKFTSGWDEEDKGQEGGKPEAPENIELICFLLIMVMASLVCIRVYVVYYIKYHIKAVINAKMDDLEFKGWKKNSEMLESWNYF